MSLILDALRKLDREKEAPDRGLVVLGAPGPQRPRTSGGGILALALILGVAVGGAFALVWLRSPAREPAPAAASRPAAPVAPIPAADPPASPASPAPASPPPASLRASPRPAAVSTPAAQTRSAAAAPATPTTASAPSAAEPAMAAPATSAEPRPAADSSELPTKASGGAPPEPRLEAISVRDGRPVAILSGRLVFEGDSFDGVQVLRIGASEVEIERDGRRQVLRF